MSILTARQPAPARTRATAPPRRDPGRSLPFLPTARIVVRRLPVARGLLEVALLAALWIAYSASRLLADDDLGAARSRAADLLHLEQLLHIDVERWLNHALSPISQVAAPMSFWYASLHYVVTPAVLAYVFFRHRGDYARTRNALVIGSAIGLACYVLIPTAPPRLMPGGAYLDTLASTADVGWWSDHASAPAGLGQMTNELAAMPSLHVGWTIWVAWALWHHTGLTGRTLACLYAAGTTMVVVATGNHWLLDAVGGVVVIAIGVALTNRFAPRPRGHTPART
ncbi:MAG: inositol phosphorylceramide synthase [Aeromicrobium sp.]|nr:inositol phosphorylceramide synthase [Aeromicrobium sp.]